MMIRVAQWGSNGDSKMWYFTRQMGCCSATTGNSMEFTYKANHSAGHYANKHEKSDGNNME